MQLIKERGSTWGHQRESFKVCLKQKQGRNLFLCWHVHKVFLEGYEKSMLSFLGRGPGSVFGGGWGGKGRSPGDVPNLLLCILFCPGLCPSGLSGDRASHWSYRPQGLQGSGPRIYSPVPHGTWGPPRTMTADTEGLSHPLPLREGRFQAAPRCPVGPSKFGGELRRAHPTRLPGALSEFCEPLTDVLFLATACLCAS